MTKKVNFSTRSQLIRGSLRYLLLEHFDSDKLTVHSRDFFNLQRPLIYCVHTSAQHYLMVMTAGKIYKWAIP